VAEADSCLACDIVSGARTPPGGVIFENDHWLVDHSVGPVMLRGFLIIKPKRHCEHIGDLDPLELSSFGQVLGLTTRALMQVLSPKKIYVCSFGELVKHVHWYIIPRMEGMPADGGEVVNVMWDGRWACSDEEAADLAVRVRAAIAI
jgi:diadenosine tetraphosphate (Ap4A) HIT family hydrolase